MEDQKNGEEMDDRKKYQNLSWSKCHTSPQSWKNVFPPFSKSVSPSYRDVFGTFPKEKFH